MRGEREESRVRGRQRRDRRAELAGWLAGKEVGSASQPAGRRAQGAGWTEEGRWRFRLTALLGWGPELLCISPVSFSLTGRPSSCCALPALSLVPALALALTLAVASAQTRLCLDPTWMQQLLALALALAIVCRLACLTALTGWQPLSTFALAWPRPAHRRCTSFPPSLS